MYIYIYIYILLNVIFAGTLGDSSTVYNSVISTMRLLKLFCILLVLWFMYAKYWCELSIKINSICCKNICLSILILLK